MAYKNNSLYSNGSRMDVNSYMSDSYRSSKDTLTAGTYNVSERPEPSLLSAASTDCIGFHELPNRQHYKNARRGYPFTLGVVGESGLGKSTLIESLFLVNLYNRDEENLANHVEERMYNQVRVNPIKLDIQENGVKVNLTIVDYPGYADRLDGQQQFNQMDSYINDQFAKFYAGENGLNRKNLVDSRVHAILYFINPTGRGLKPLDIEFIRNFQDKVNIIPIIAKSDMLTVHERQELKARIRLQVEDEKLKVYSYPQTMDSDDFSDPAYLKTVNKYREKWPFAVIGSVEEFDFKGKIIRGRQYPWGVIDILDERHSDFSILRSLLVTYMLELVDLTHDVHYERYRENRMFERNKENYASPAHHNTTKASYGYADYSNLSAGGDCELSRGSTADTEALKAKDDEINKLREQMLRMQQQLVDSQLGSPGSNYDRTRDYGERDSQKHVVV